MAAASPVAGLIGRMAAQAGVILRASGWRVGLAGRRLAQGTESDFGERALLAFRIGLHVGFALAVALLAGRSTSIAMFAMPGLVNRQYRFGFRVIVALRTHGILLLPVGYRVSCITVSREPQAHRPAYNHVEEGG